MNRLTTTLLGAALVVILTASAAQAQGDGRAYRGGSSGLRLHNPLEQGSQQQCTDGRCCAGNERCADGHCDARCKTFDGQKCTNPNCAECEESAAYDEIDLEEDFDPDN